LPDQGRMLTRSVLSTASLYVISCRSLPGFVALKGQEKGNVGQLACYWRIRLSPESILNKS